MNRGRHVLDISTHVPRPLAEVFAFFSDAANLERITPPELRFELTTPTPIEMKVGSLIDYRLRLFGVSFGWRTRIADWEPGVKFVDEQLKGPYAEWIHTHSFRADANGTWVGDNVQYRLPLFPLSEIALPIVKLQLHRIFKYRTRKIAELLGPV
ncbi:MAG: SRPBCC family protein [Gemmatimonadaceae bacterium]